MRRLDALRSQILQTMIDSELDLELVEWTVPVLKTSTWESGGPLCPVSGSVLTFYTFIRIRPPPREGAVQLRPEAGTIIAGGVSHRKFVCHESPEGDTKENQCIARRALPPVGSPTVA